MSFDYISIIDKVPPVLFANIKGLIASIPVLYQQAPVLVIFAACTIAIFLRVPLIRGIIMLPFKALLNIFKFTGLVKEANRWGIVYDSVSKLPVDPAYVTVKDTLGRAVATAITDLDGRFGVLLGRGLYTVEVQKTNYVFPSEKLKGMKSDGDYNHLYFGEQLEVLSRDQSLAVSIPMDPVGKDWNQLEKKRKNIFFHTERVHEFKQAVAFYFLVGAGVSICRLIYLRDEISLKLVVAYGALAIIGSLWDAFKPKEYHHSVIIDRKTNTPLSFARVRIYMAGNNFEITHKITSLDGQFVCLVPKGRYYVTIEKRGEKGEYTKVHTSSSFRVSKGYIGKYFRV